MAVAVWEIDPMARSVNNLDPLDFDFDLVVVDLVIGLVVSVAVVEVVVVVGIVVVVVVDDAVVVVVFVPQWPLSMCLVRPPPPPPPAFCPVLR